MTKWRPTPLHVTGRYIENDGASKPSLGRVATLAWVERGSPAARSGVREASCSLLKQGGCFSRGLGGGFTQAPSDLALEQAREVR